MASHGIEFRITLLNEDESPRYTPDYAEPSVLGAQHCTYCTDACYFTPADFKCFYSFQWDAGDNGDAYILLCKNHIVAAMENFRDIGR